MTCCCSLAGTAACRHCSNNYYADMENWDRYKIITLPHTNPYSDIKFNFADEEENTKASVKCFCPECATSVDVGDKFCRGCGIELDW